MSKKKHSGLYLGRDTWSHQEYDWITFKGKGKKTVAKIKLCDNKEVLKIIGLPAAALKKRMSTKSDYFSDEKKSDC